MSLKRFLVWDLGVNNEEKRITKDHQLTFHSSHSFIFSRKLSFSPLFPSLPNTQTLKIATLLTCLNHAFQILPINIKGLAGSIATLANWLTSWVITMTANLLLSWSRGGVFLSIEYSDACFCFHMTEYNKTLYYNNRDIHNLHSNSCLYRCFFCNVGPWNQGKNFGRDSVVLSMIMLRRARSQGFLICFAKYVSCNKEMKGKIFAWIFLSTRDWKQNNTFLQIKIL